MNLEEQTLCKRKKQHLSLTYAGRSERKQNYVKKQTLQNVIYKKAY